MHYNRFPFLTSPDYKLCILQILFAYQASLLFLLFECYLFFVLFPLLCQLVFAFLSQIFKKFWRDVHFLRTDERIMHYRVQYFIIFCQSYEWMFRISRQTDSKFLQYMHYSVHHELVLIHMFLRLIDQFELKVILVFYLCLFE